MLDRFTSETFTPLVGEVFSVGAADGEPFEVVLSSCEETPYGSREGWEATVRRVPFSLVFHAADGRLVEQQTCTVSHADLGAFPLFLVPLGPDDGGMRYQAVVS